MAEGLFDLPAVGVVEQGKRTERTEWAVRWTRELPNIARKGTIEPASSREYAERRASYMLNGSALEVVSRQVVSYTSDWEVTA